MSFYLKSLSVLMVGALTAGCSQMAEKADAPKALTDNNFNSTLWVQTAGEYKANALQAYNAAMGNLSAITRLSTQSAALEQTANYESLPAAVVLDIDETVLDNSKYQANLVLTGTGFNPAMWDEWVAKQAAGAVPGAVEFINYARATGVEVFYITNRECMVRAGNTDPCPQEADTLANMEALGIQGVTPEHMLLKGEYSDWTSEKTTRRANIATNYRVAMLFGDDLADFLPNVKKDITYQERANLVSVHGNKWGSVWYMLPNPTYGSWMRVLKGDQAGYLTGH